MRPSRCTVWPVFYVSAIRECVSTGIRAEAGRAGREWQRNFNQCAFSQSRRNLDGSAQTPNPFVHSRQAQGVGPAVVEAASVVLNRDEEP